MKIVLSLGGSVLLGSEPKGVSEGLVKRIKEFARAIKKLSEEHSIFVVVGGGRVSREYIGIARSLGADETYSDYIGIAVTRINAMLLSLAIDNAPKTIPEDFIRAYELSTVHPVVVMGGTFPGHTTDATAALLAEFVDADLLLNATSVDGVYSADPKVDEAAKRFERLSFSELVEIISRGEVKAGSSNVIDLLAAKIIQRSGIRTIIFLGTPENILRAVKGDVSGIGTVVE
jgi:uridylate kinase